MVKKKLITCMLFQNDVKGNDTNGKLPAATPGSGEFFSEKKNES